jgi:DNA repair protein SbcD/Mre11
MKKVSFIHAADLHLDSPMVGLRYLPHPIFSRLRESTFEALKKVTRAAIENKVDFVILAGDLFDGEDRSLRAQSRLRNEMLKLGEKGIPVYVIHGNHDHLSGSWVQLDLPANVHIFTSEVESKTLATKGGALVHLYGFSYPKRHVWDRKIDDYMKHDGADFHIGILHGNEGSQSEHGNYAPFTVNDLVEKQFDYWALGHIHKRSVLIDDPPIVYPGNIQGRNKKETGIKGCYHVTLSELETNLQFIPTSDVVWEEVVIDASSARNVQETLQICDDTKKSFRKNKMGTLLTLSLKNLQIIDHIEELIEILQEEEQEEDSFVWIVDVIVEQSKVMDREHLTEKAEFYHELFNTVDQYESTGHALDSLYGHRLGKKYLTQLSPEDQQQLLKKAEDLLIKFLYQSS